MDLAISKNPNLRKWLRLIIGLLIFIIEYFILQNKCFGAVEQSPLVGYLSDEKNKVDIVAVDSAARDIVVLIHGWTQKNKIGPGYSAYNDSEEWAGLIEKLKGRLTGQENKLYAYHWEEDATTGSANFFTNFDFVGFGSATVAAVSAFHEHGPHLAALLKQVAPNLRTVHFIAHSAGSWAARNAAEIILAENQNITVQVTLLDPFIPDADPLVGTLTGLNTSKMNEIGAGTVAGDDRIFKLENYFAYDVTGFSTLQQFTSFSVNFRVDWPTIIVGKSQYGDWQIPVSPIPIVFGHSGPIQFYADTVATTIPGADIPAGLTGAYYYSENANVLGWANSIFVNQLVEIRLRDQNSSTIHVREAQTLALQADALARRKIQGLPGLAPAPTYSWWKTNKITGVREKLDESLFNSFTLPAATLSSGGEYEVQANNGTGPIKVSFSVVVDPPNPVFDLVVSGTSGGNALEVQVAVASVFSPVLLTNAATRSYAQGTSVTLTAPATAPNGAAFVQWLIDGVSNQTARTVTVLMDHAHSAVAVYQSAGSKPVAVFLQPQANLAITEPSLVTALVSATASSPATITQVQFFLDGVLAKTDTSAPYSYDGLFLATLNGTRKIAAIATDSQGRTSDRVETNLIVAINVAGIPSLPVDRTLPSATSGVSYLQTLTASGGVAPYVWTAVGSAILPAGLTLNGGMISGTPTSSGSFTFRLRATGTNGQSAEGDYTLFVASPASVATPQFTPAPGSFSGPVTMSVTTATADAVLRYTTDGSEPTATSIRFPGTFQVTQTMTIKAKAFKTGYQDSATAAGTYEIGYSQTTATPNITPAAGSYTDPVTVSMYSTTFSTEIYYTLDGSTPVPEVSTRYNGQFTLYGTATVKAIGVARGLNPSAIATAGYVVSTSANNDSFANRRSIQGAIGQSSGSNLTATKEAGEPIIYLQDRGEAYNPGGRSIWWRWRAPYSGKVTIDTIGSDFDSLLGVYLGSDVSQLTYVAGDDASGDQYSTSKVTFDAVQGREYQIVVDGQADRVNGVWTAVTRTGCGHILLNWHLLDPAPEPDLITDYRWVVRGGGTAEDVGQGVALDATGNVYTTGYFGGTADFGGETLVSLGGKDVFIAKYAASDGRLLWAQRAGGTGSDQGFGIAAGADGKIYVVGTTSGEARFGAVPTEATASSAGIFVACYSSEGHALWARSYGDASAAAHRIVMDSAGNLLVAGTFSGTADFGGVSLTSAGSTDMFVMKLLPGDGTAIWAKSAGGTNSDIGYSVAVDAADRVYVAGETRSFTTNFGPISIVRNTGLFNAFAACYASTGGEIWAKTYSSQGVNHAKSVVVDAAGNLYVAGAYSGTLTFGANVTGAKSFTDFFLIKLKSDGTLLWTREFGSPSGNDGGFFSMDFKDICLGLDELGNIVVSGLYAGTVTVGATQITARGDADVLTAKITPTGDFIWLKTAGTDRPNAAWPSDIAVSPLGVIFQTGRSMATTTFSALSTISAGDKDYFLARLSAPINGMPATPVNLAPGATAAASPSGLTFQASGFSDPDNGDTHQASQWLIRRQGDNAVVYDSGTDANNKTSLTVVAPLEAGGVYSWQVRYQDNHDAWSDYSASTSFAISTAKFYQTIQFDALSDRIFGDAEFELSATASSGLPTVIQVVSGAARIAGSRVTLLGAGLVTFRATQEGNADYAPATPVDRVLFVAEKTLVVRFGDLTQSYNGSERVVALQSDLGDADIILTYNGGLSPPTNAGSYAVRGVVSSANYQGEISDTLTISKAALTARANNLTRRVGDANPALTITYTGFVNNDTAASVTAPTASTTATTESPVGVYPITLTGGAAANYVLTLVNGTLTVAPPSYAGSYFGTLASGGRWALHVRADNTATFIAYLPSRQSAIVVNLTVNADGSFTIPGTEIKSSSVATVRSLALAGPEAPVIRTAAAASPYTLAGQIGAGGAVTGQLTGLGETFTGTADATTGAAQSSAGYYAASALGTATGATYAIVSPTGQALVITTGTTVDSASGTVSASGQLTATTSGNAALALTINPSTSRVTATLTPSGSSTPITYAGLSETVTPLSRVVNLSVRTPSGTGDRTLILGFVITGSGTKSLLLRGIGPTLSTQGVGSPLADPTLRLLNRDRVELAVNNDWGGGSELSQRFSSVGAFALPADSKDAALFRALAPGVYSFHILPNGAGTGVALGEVYDAADDTSTAAVVNVAARTQVGTGEDVLIAGFVITGNAPKTLLIRGLGPTLVGQGVAGALADPQLYLYKGPDLIGSNDNWGGTYELTDAFNLVGAGSLISYNSKDAALLVTLEPGVYSAQLSGVNGTTGIGLVEIYLLP